MGSSGQWLVFYVNVPVKKLVSGRCKERMFTQNNYFAKNKTNIINKNNNQTIFNDIKIIFYGMHIQIIQK